MRRSILDVARIIRSKNSGPFELTLDIMFRHKRHFELFRRKRILTPHRIARLYHADPNDVLGIIYFEPCYAVKVTLRRWIPSGSPGESDVYGAQQHAPLLGITFDDREP